ncbi:hypothetical protein [Dehalobacter restrictus]|uniref:Uncharacterized protein n=1 Tax=Dehalobacter restrictus TaxID=55583 RepID=A0A857DK53_9FIRM|nr:hypothetical protein [Dehalobacter restrictus]QHA00978.1 hypothetical protein GQ588_10200 [Dehalobacter restrictus]
MMKLYALKCDQGYLKRTETGCQCVDLEKATVVTEIGLDALDKLAEKASQAGCCKIFVIELQVTEGNCVKGF